MRRKPYFFIILSILIVIIVCVTAIALYFNKKETVSNLNLELNLELDDTILMSVVNGISGVQSIVFIVTMKNVGNVDLINFDFSGTPFQMNDAFTKCEIPLLAVGQSYKCYSDKINVSTLNEGNTNFTLKVTTFYNYNNTLYNFSLKGSAMVNVQHDKTQNYTFTYPVDKQDGYYTVPWSSCPADKCSECLPDNLPCSYLYAYSEYRINTGYIENFTFTNKYPIYGAWKIRDFNDFGEKCFVGDCNSANLRNTICINKDTTFTMQTDSCNKWVKTINENTKYMLFCINETKYAWSGNSLVKLSSSCKNPNIVNVYYIYNDWPGYEGYSADWKQRWEVRMNKLANYLDDYGIYLTFNYYEQKLADNSNLPSALVDRAPNILPGDIQISIFSGRNGAQDYNLSCSGYAYNPCSTSATENRIRLSCDCGRDDLAYTNLIHEFGHILGCPHTGALGSLSATLYAQDIMSYGSYGEERDFLYECKILIWMLGQS